MIKGVGYLHLSWFLTFQLTANLLVHAVISSNRAPVTRFLWYFCTDLYIHPLTWTAVNRPMLSDNLAEIPFLPISSSAMSWICWYFTFSFTIEKMLWFSTLQKSPSDFDWVKVYLYFKTDYAPSSPCMSTITSAPYSRAGELKLWSCDCSPQQPVHPGAPCVQWCWHGAQQSQKQASAHRANATHFYQWAASWSQCVGFNFLPVQLTLGIDPLVCFEIKCAWCHQEREKEAGLVFLSFD